MRPCFGIELAVTGIDTLGPPSQVYPNHSQRDDVSSSV